MHQPIIDPLTGANLTDAPERIARDLRRTGRTTPSACHWRPALSALLAASVAGCVAGLPPRPLVTDQQVILEGRVISVDLTPMAYDGNALLVLATGSHGAVTVHLPARRNLCKAQGLDMTGELKPGDGLRVTGTATGPADVSVCAQPSDRLQRID